eukprot:767945-Hanusia_phi.AAC.11
MQAARAVTQPMKIGGWRMLGKIGSQSHQHSHLLPYRLLSSPPTSLKTRLQPLCSIPLSRGFTTLTTPRLGEGSLPGVGSLDSQMSRVQSCISYVISRRMLSTDAVVTAAEPMGITPGAVEKKPNPRHNAEHHGFPRARAVLRRFRTSMKKLNLVCRLVRRARVDAALMQLSLTRKRVADKVRRCIHDAKFNAANNHGTTYLQCCSANIAFSGSLTYFTGMDPDNLLIDEIKIGRSDIRKVRPCS